MDMTRKAFINLRLEKQYIFIINKVENITNMYISDYSNSQANIL